MLSGQALYDKLYSTGYHQDLSLSHALYLSYDLHNMSNYQGYQISKVLDVGCSHGLGVKRLWELGFRASGVDLSAVAVGRARANRKPPRRRGQSHSEAVAKWCVGTCFQQSSATSLPFANGAFDAALSTDVLEHLSPEDVPLAVRELTRVTRRLLFLKIAPRKEALGAELGRLRALQNASGEAARAAPPAPNASHRQCHARLRLLLTSRRRLDGASANAATSDGSQHTLLAGPVCSGRVCVAPPPRGGDEVAGKVQAPLLQLCAGARRADETHDGVRMRCAYRTSSVFILVGSVHTYLARTRKWRAWGAGQGSWGRPGRGGRRSRAWGGTPARPGVAPLPARPWGATSPFFYTCVVFIHITL